MKSILPLVFAAFFVNSGTAQTTDPEVASTLFVLADIADLNEFRWKKRPVLVFADSENDPAFIEQIALLRAQQDELALRDVVVLSDTNPDARHPLRLRMRPRGFMLVLVGKDGDIKLRKPFPWSVREISRSIDKMTIRQREIRENKDSDG